MNRFMGQFLVQIVDPPPKLPYYMQNAYPCMITFIEIPFQSSEVASVQSLKLAKELLLLRD